MPVRRAGDRGARASPSWSPTDRWTRTAAPGWRDARPWAWPGVPVSGRDLDPYFAAAVEATEEAVLNSLLAATTVTGRDGRTVPALPVDRLLPLLVRA